jgi:hypothetical protein
VIIIFSFMGFVCDDGSKKEEVEEEKACDMLKL